MRLHLGFDRKAWVALSWWEQRLYLEELAYDGKLQSDQGPEEADLNDLAASGIQVRKVRPSSAA